MPSPQFICLYRYSFIITAVEIAHRFYNKLHLLIAYLGIQRQGEHLPGNLLGYGKVEVAQAKGKKLYDKRESVARREAEREMERVLKSHKHSKR